MTSSHDQRAQPAGTTAPGHGLARPRGRAAAALLAAAAPLAAALATAPAAVAFATTAPPAAHSHAPAGELLTTTTLPATTAVTCAPCDPKIPAMVGD
jgi:hypothetical protein